MARESLNKTNIFLDRIYKKTTLGWTVRLSYIQDAWCLKVKHVSTIARAGQLSRYNDWLRAGRSGDRIPLGARFSAPVQTGPGAHPASCTMGKGSFPGLKSGQGVTLTPHPFQCRGEERVELYLYSPYGSYGLYRASLPVQRCTFTLTYFQLVGPFSLGFRIQKISMNLEPLGAIR